MRASEFIFEGGWASAKTQDTVITPATIESAVGVLKKFNSLVNQIAKEKGALPAKIGNPVGSGTYYKRDLEQNPTKEYGDIDVQFILNKVPGLNTNQIQQMYFDIVKEACYRDNTFETENGKNVIFGLGNDQYVQVDLVVVFSESLEFSAALAPEWNVKGVLSASLYSALAEVLHLSIGSLGVLAKTIDGKIVKFLTQKGTELHTVSLDRNNWARDVAKFLGCKQLSPSLGANPGMKDEVRIIDIIASIKGIAESLELNDLADANNILQQVKASYLSKINKVVTSSKFDKAASPAAVEKANKQKEMLSTKSQEIANRII
jgi:hypothetical protein